jgi:hypothetical protein
MSIENTPTAPDDWKRRTGRCAECHFDWAETDCETLVGQCVHAVAVFGEVLSRIELSEAVEPGLWTASRYVWHTVDVCLMAKFTPEYPAQKLGHDLALELLDDVRRLSTPSCESPIARSESP